MSSDFTRALASGFLPRKRMTGSVWAENHIVLSDDSASAGPYRIGDATYQREWLDVITDPDIDCAVFVTSSQVGKTTVLKVTQGYFALAEPCQQLSVWPLDKLAKEYQTEKFSRMVEDSPKLKAVVRDTDYPGGEINFVGSNNPHDLAGRAIRVVSGDELDRWKRSSGKEGSPVVIARRRMETYFNAKELWASTPVHEGASLIVDLFKTTRQHYFHVVCPDCGHAQILRWETEDGKKCVVFEKGEEHKARYMCQGAGCGSLWHDLTKRRLVREADTPEGRRKGGGWRHLATAPFKVFQQHEKPLATHKGFWINALYSPWSSLFKIAREFSDAEGDPLKLQGFQNTVLGLPWKGDVSSFADWELIYSRREPYDPMSVPAGAALLTAAIDVQNDRLEILVVAWGLDEESWVLNKTVIHMDPSTGRAWALATEALTRRYPHPTGYTLGIEAVAIDSGGSFTQQVYAFSGAATKRGDPWFAIAGRGGAGKPIWKASEVNPKKGVKLFIIGVDDAKSTLYTRYGLTAPGPGYIHVHEGVSEADARQMTAETAKIEYDDKGFPEKTWENPKRLRNEMLDLMVYNLAAYSSLNIDIGLRLANLNGTYVHNTPDLEQLGRDYKDLNDGSAMPAA